MEFVDNMQQSRVSHHSVMGVLPELHGARENIPFTNRDLENSGKRAMKLKAVALKVMAAASQAMANWKMNQNDLSKMYHEFQFVVVSGGDEFGKELPKLPDGSPASIYGDSSGSHSPERLPTSPVMRDVDLPPEFRVTGPPTPDWPTPPSPSDEERFWEELY
uniref:Uncharacterized protein n=1 Tax=Oryza barthii TaxID=65489 RepID=A0A0D3GGZ1_9ORYZ